MILPCSVQHFKAIGQLKHELWADEISQDLSLRWISDGYPILHKAKVRSAPTVEHRWGLLSEQLPRYTGETNHAYVTAAGGASRHGGSGLGPRSDMDPLRFHWKIVPKVSINNIPALVQIMAWPRPARRQAIVWTNDGYFNESNRKHVHGCKMVANSVKLDGHLQFTSKFLQNVMSDICYPLLTFKPQQHEREMLMIFFIFILGDHLKPVSSISTVDQSSRYCAI